MILVTPLFVVIGAFLARRKTVGEPWIAALLGAARETWLIALLGAISFSIWTFSVPFNGWQKLRLIEENSGAAALIAAVAGLLFSQLAQGLTTDVALKIKE